MIEHGKAHRSQDEPPGRLHLRLLLDDIHASPADTGHPATQRVLDDALVALERALIRSTPRPARGAGDGR